MSPQWVVFTDLDGTLLEVENYSYAPAREALNLIEQSNIPLVFNSSKTVGEILLLRDEMKNQHPFVVENGAAVIVPNHYFADLEILEPLPAKQHAKQYCIKRFSQPYEHILEVLHLAREQGFTFEGFSDWSAAQLTDICALPLRNAALAKQRIGSEPILFKGELAHFIEFLAQYQLRAVQGGRFLHVMGQYDKADGVAWLLDAFQRKFDPKPIRSVALGDSHNDEGMLNTVEVPIVIKSRHSEQIHLTHLEQARFSNATGPAGWNEQLLKLLRE